MSQRLGIVRLWCLRSASFAALRVSNDSAREYQAVNSDYERSDHMASLRRLGTKTRFCLPETWFRLSCALFPSSSRRGGCAFKKKLRSILSRADGVVSKH